MKKVIISTILMLGLLAGSAYGVNIAEAANNAVNSTLSTVEGKFEEISENASNYDNKAVRFSGELSKHYPRVGFLVTGMVAGDATRRFYNFAKKYPNLTPVIAGMVASGVLAKYIYDNKLPDDYRIALKDASPKVKRVLALMILSSGGLAGYTANKNIRGAGQ